MKCKFCSEAIEKCNRQCQAGGYIHTSTKLHMCSDLYPYKYAEPDDIPNPTNLGCQ
jgi:hypothetical protein